MFENIFKVEEKKNPFLSQSETLFHEVCEYGNHKIAEMFVKKSFESDVNLHVNSGIARKLVPHNSGKVGCLESIPY